MNTIVKNYNSVLIKYNLSLALGVLFLLIFWALLSENPIESIFSIAVLALILILFWKQNQVFILAYCLIWHWLEIFTSVFEANYYGLDLNENFPDTGRLTTWLAGLGLVSVIFGLYRATKDYHQNVTENSLKIIAFKINIKKLTRIYIIAWLVSTILGQIAWSFPQITQLLLHLTRIKLIIFIFFSFVIFIRGDNYKLIFWVSIFEFINGLFSYFADFKIIFIVLGLTMIINIKKLKLKQIIIYSSIFLMAFTSLFYWQIVKEDYRKFLNSSGGMTVQTGFYESLSELYRLVDNVHSSDFDIATKAVFRRLGYLEYFSTTISRVPRYIPHENGQLLYDNLKYVLIPRFFNPNKKSKNDTDKAVKYANKIVWTQGSFSLSYYAEAYIDFREIGMMGFLFIFGWLVGKLYLACFRLKGINTLLLYSITIVVLLPFASYGADAISIFGTLIWGAVSHLLIFPVIYRRISNYVQ